MNEFYERLAEIVDVPGVKPADVLTEFAAWDSLSVLSTIALIGSKYGVMLSAADLQKISTAEQLWHLIESRRAGARG